MITMNITVIPNYGQAWLVTEDEVKRLVKAVNDGETLEYISEKGESVRLESGNLYVDGFESVPPLFAIEEREYYGTKVVNFQSEATRPLKSLVKKIIVSDGTKFIWHSFEGFSKLKEVVLPNSIETLVDAFEDCPELKAYPLPESIRFISGDFYGLYPENLILPEGLTTLWTTFGNSDVRTVTLPSSLAELSGSTFKRCINLESVNFSEGLESIGSEAFSGCKKLEKLTFPQSLKSIGSYAFNECTSLTTVDFPKDCSISPTAFKNTSIDCKIQAIRVLSLDHISYDDKMGEIKNFEAIKSVLAGKPLEEQFGYFTTDSRYMVERSSYGEAESIAEHSKSNETFPTEEIENLIIKDGIIVGIVMDSTNILVGNTECTYYASEDDGAGRRERTDYGSLFFKNTK